MSVFGVAAYIGGRGNGGPPNIIGILIFGVLVMCACLYLAYCGPGITKIVSAHLAYDPHVITPQLLRTAETTPTPLPRGDPHPPTFPGTGPLFSSSNSRWGSVPPAPFRRNNTSTVSINNA
jgi:hypothetical protein